MLPKVNYIPNRVKQTFLHDRSQKRLGVGQGFVKLAKLRHGKLATDTNTDEWHSGDESDCAGDEAVDVRGGVVDVRHERESKLRMP